MSLYNLFRRGVWKLKKLLDRVTEAYYDQMGLNFGNKVRRRIHWVCEQAKGETILDVGCSQGITSILLGRESKQVLGIDLMQESIDYANEMLSNEAEVTKKYVEFKTANFIDYDFGERKFDVIIFGEVLEHLTDPARFMKKATEMLSDNGRIIVTVPFGINDYFDHKKTFYMQGLLDLKNDQLNINALELFGKWIGAVFVKGNEVTESINLNGKLLNRLELGFYDIERDLVDQVTTLNNQYEKSKKINTDTHLKLKEKTKELVELKATIEKLNTTITHIETVNEDLKQSLLNIEHENNIKNANIKEQEILINDLTSKLESAEKRNEHSLNDLEQKIKDLMNELNQRSQDLSEQLLTKDRRIVFLEEELAELRKTKIESEKKKTPKVDQSQLIALQQEVLNEKRKKVKSDELLLEAYNKEERLLKAHSQLLKRYEALKNSKLGRLTISYWKWRRKRSGGKLSGSKGN